MRGDPAMKLGYHSWWIAGLVLPATALRPAEPLAIVAPAGPDHLSSEEAKRDARVLVRALNELHPALTKYRTPEEIAAAFARFEARAGGARTRGEMFLAAAELTAAIRCGHTWPQPRFNQSPAVAALLTERADKLPLHLVFVEGRWLVTASADPAVRPGDELLALGGIDAPNMAARMMPYLRADGSSDGKRLVQLCHIGETSQMDFIWPLLHPPTGGFYEATVRHSDGASEKNRIAAITFAERKTRLAATGVKPQSDDWTRVTRGDTCVLTLPTFAFWNNPFDWRGYLDATFAELAKNETKFLVVDLRANEGGSGDIGPALLARLIRQPLKVPANLPYGAYERVPYILARYLDTWDFNFFDRTGRVEKEGERRYLLKTKVQADVTIEPHPQPFAGRTFFLIGAENSSATFLLARLVKLSGAATLVGQPTGGNLRGLNGGELCWVTLPASGVGVDIPLVAGIPPTPQPDAAIEPDVAVRRTFAGLAAGRDPEWEAVARLIDDARRAR